MSNIEHAFERLLDRKPSETEIKRLYRIKEALNLSDNDALWEILIAFESYDTLYRRYPALISSHTSKVLKDINESMRLIAEAETKKALGSLTNAVSKSSASLAGKMTDAIRWQIWGFASIGLVLFGSLCVFVGFVLGSGKLPYWALNRHEESFLSTILSVLANTPAGWIIAVCGSVAAFASIYRVKEEIKQRKKLPLVFSAFALSTLSLVFLWPIFGQ